MFQVSQDFISEVGSYKVELELLDFINISRRNPNMPCLENTEWLMWLIRPVVISIYCHNSDSASKWTCLCTGAFQADKASQRPL